MTLAKKRPKRPTAKRELESYIQSRILEALEARRIWAIRINSGGVKTKTGWFRGAPAGTPDICVLAPVAGWIEVKRPGGKATSLQSAWHTRAAREGVRVAVVMSATEALEVVQQWAKEES